MSESEVIAATPKPNTRPSLAADLRALGLEEGATVIVHSSLRALGWVIGAEVAVIRALMDCLTENGTLVMPAHSSDLSEPSDWENPPVPEGWWPLIRQQMPPYDPQRTPTRGIGRVAEAFRTWPQVLRSDHPALSFSAWGRHAQRVTAHHQLAQALGEGSPLARLYDLEAQVLLLGADYGANTSFHLGEYRAPDAVEIEQGAPLLRAGEHRWVTYADIEFHEEVFPELGRAFEATTAVTRGQVGSADCRLFPQRACVDFATNWIAERRSRAGSGRAPNSSAAG